MSGRRIAAGVGASWFLTASRLLVNLVAMGLLYASLPRQLLGVWVSFSALAAFLAVSDLGLNFTTSRALSYHLGRRRGGNEAPEDLRSELLAYSPADLLKTVGAVYAALGGLLLVMAFLLGPVWLEASGLTGEVLAQAQRAWWLYALGYALALAGSIPNYALQGLGDLGIDSGAQALALWVGLLAQALLLKNGYGIDALGAVYLAQNILTRGLLWWLLLRRHAWIFEPAGRFRPPLLRALLVESKGMFLTQLGAMLSYQAAPLLIVWYLGSEALPDYNLAWTLALFGNQVAMAIPPALGPFVAQARYRSDDAAIRRMLASGMRAVLSLQVVYGILVLLLAPWLLTLWVGPGHFVGYAILLAFVAQNFLDQQHASIGFFAWNSGHWPFGWLALAGGVLQCVFVALGVRYWGLLGAAGGSLLAQLCTNNIVIVVSTLRRLGVPLRRYAKDVLAPVLGLAGLTLLVCASTAWGLGSRPAWGRSFRHLDLGHWVALLSTVAVAGLVSGAAIWWKILGPELRQSLLGRLRGAARSGGEA